METKAANMSEGSSGSNFKCCVNTHKGGNDDFKENKLSQMIPALCLGKRDHSNGKQNQGR